MELIKQIFAFGGNNPLLSASIVLVFLFGYYVIVLRKRRVMQELLAELYVEKASTASSTYEKNLERYGHSYAHLWKNEKSPIEQNIEKQIIVCKYYNFQLVLGLLWIIPVYYLWAPISIILSPVVLAVGVVYPDKLVSFLRKTPSQKNDGQSSEMGLE